MSWQDLKPNPFEPGTDRHEVWDVLVRRDIEAFVRADWESASRDFYEDNFLGIDGGGSADPSRWRLAFPTLDDYRASWLSQSADLVHDSDLTAQDLDAATTLTEIEITGDTALAHKIFDGFISRADGSTVALDWQSLYWCVRTDDGWKIRGFVGYLPRRFEDGASPSAAERATARKHLPPSSTQHATAGPYSPVLTVTGGSFVVISGQAAITDDGPVVGDDICEQAELTLRNCQRQLATAGVGLADVFKVNVYLTDLGHWPAFNEVYRDWMPHPRPVRTAVGVKLLPGMLVEVEMWAAVPS